ncbi:hypothetical protein Tco_0640441 [Tanacetum coccineum]
MSSENKLTKDEGGESVENTKYRSMIGSLLYLTTSRSYNMFSVCLYAHFQEDPKSSHLAAIKRIFRYIKGTTHLGLWYPKGTGVETIVYADFDHAGDYVDRKSTKGVCTFMGCCLTSWFSKKQTALAISITEAEYVSVSKACQQELRMKQALVDYDIKLNDIPVLCDNKGAINLSKNPVLHSRTKHIEIRHHFLRDNVQKGNISIEKDTHDKDEDEDEDKEEEEEHPAPANSVPPVHRMTARISIRDEPSISLPPRKEVERLLALTTPPPSPLTLLSSPLSQIPSPPLPIPSPPPNSPTHIEIPESCLPLWKRVRFASPTPSHEVRESSAAGAARQDGPAVAREDPYSIARGDLYGFDDLVGAIDEIAPTTLEGVNHRVTDLSTIVEQETTIMYGIMEDARDDRSQLRGRVNLYRDRPVHRLAQSALISELQSADHRRQRVISELLASDHKRQVQLTKTLRLLKGLQTQMVEFQRQHGPAKGLAQPDAPGEAGSSS